MNNDKIKELLEKSGFRYIKDDGIGWAGNYNSSLPKFAALIVKECLDQCYNNGMNDALYEGQLKAAAYIEQHFGVDYE
jgi:hypothetical protein